MPDYSRLDDALDRLAQCGSDLNNGFTSHAPMMAEALSALGRPDAIMPWVESYRTSLLPRPSSNRPISADSWRAALGRTERLGDWQVYFAELIDANSWRHVVRDWAPRLAPGLSGAALHGVIRAGHAVRAVDDRETPARLRELADGFGYWAAHFASLPTAAYEGPVCAARDAIGRVPLVPAEKSTFRGSIVSAMAALDALPGFAGAIGILDLSRGPIETLSEVSELFARDVLANARDGLSTIVFVHAVTGAAAIRSLLPHVDEDAGRAFVRYAWQAGIALHAAFAVAQPVTTAVQAPDMTMEARITMAVACGDEHAVKFTEAALREYALSPSPAYLAAAALVTANLAAA